MDLQLNALIESSRGLFYYESKKNEYYCFNI